MKENIENADSVTIEELVDWQPTVGSDAFNEGFEVSVLNIYGIFTNFNVLGILNIITRLNIFNIFFHAISFFPFISDSTLNNVPFFPTTIVT